MRFTSDKNTQKIPAQTYAAIGRGTRRQPALNRTIGGLIRGKRRSRFQTQPNYSAEFFVTQDGAFLIYAEWVENRPSNCNRK